MLVLIRQSVSVVSGGATLDAPGLAGALLTFGLFGLHVDIETTTKKERKLKTGFLEFG